MHGPKPGAWEGADSVITGIPLDADPRQAEMVLVVAQQVLDTQLILDGQQEGAV